MKLRKSRRCNLDQQKINAENPEFCQWLGANFIESSFSFRNMALLKVFLIQFVMFDIWCGDSRAPD